MGGALEMYEKFPSTPPSSYILRGVGLSFYQSICLSIYLSIYLSICKLENLAILRDFFIFKLTTSKTQHFCETSSFVVVDNIKNEAILRDLLIFWSWPHQKRSNSARLPHFSKLTTSKTKQFCEPSFKNGKLSAELTASYQWVLRFFQSTCLNYSELLPLPRKSDAKSYEVLHLSCKIISANLKIWCSKMQTLSGNQRPDLLTSLMNMSLVLRLPREMRSLKILFKCPTPAIAFGHATKPSRFARFWQGAQSLAPATRKHIWTSCASRHNGVHFFDISTSKSGP